MVDQWNNIYKRGYTPQKFLSFLQFHSSCGLTRALARDILLAPVLTVEQWNFKLSNLFSVKTKLLIIKERSPGRQPQDPPFYNGSQCALRGNHDGGKLA